jgi:putative ABC transport system permease protein
MRLGGAAGRLAAGNATRNTGRTAATAAALMIGIALVAFVATLGAGLRSSLGDALNKQVTADYVVSPSSSDSSAAFPAKETSALTALPGVKAVTGIQTDQARIFGAATGVAGIDPKTITHAYRFYWKHGSNAVLRKLGNGAILDSAYAKTHHLQLGSVFTVESSTGATSTLIVKATYRAPQAKPLLPNVVISQPSFDRAFPKPWGEPFAFVSVDGGVNPATTAQLKHALAAFPDLTVQTRAAWVIKQGKSVNQILDLFYVLLALSVIISLFGMVNTLVLSVFERTRELGMLRAIGMTRRQMRRMIRHESIITALIGAALGLPLGVFLAALVTRGLSNLGVSFHLPVPQLLLFGLIAIAAGIAAAVFPARRAARLNVLEALQYE